MSARSDLQNYHGGTTPTPWPDPDPSSAALETPHEDAAASLGAAEEWMAKASHLADWAMKRLVNRRDRWGIYGEWTTKDGRPQKVRTAPSPRELKQGRLLGLPDLIGHFEARVIVGLHSTSAAATSQWIAWDFDQHDAALDAACNAAKSNFAAALNLVAHLRTFGLRSILEDSNGRGGYHVWVLFESPVETTRAFAFAQQTIRELALSAESYPKQVDIGQGLGNWLRVPGRHHSHDHWSRFYDGDHWLNEADSVAWLLGMRPNSPDLVPDVAPPTRARQPVSGKPASIPVPKPAQFPTRARDRQAALKCLSKLSPARADGYDDWIEVGMALHAVDATLLDAWDTWSRSSTKYEEGACTAKWRTFNGSGVGLGSLVLWARQDDPASPGAADTSRVGLASGPACSIRPSTLPAHQSSTDPVDACERAPAQALSSEPAPRESREELLEGAVVATAIAVRPPAAVVGTLIPSCDLELTDAGNARRFATQYRDQLRYSHQWKRWFEWDGRRWAPDLSGAINRAVSEFVRSEKAAAAGRLAAASAGSPEERNTKDWMDHAIKSQSKRALDAIEALARHEAPIPVSIADFDRDPWLLNCLNGTLDLRSGVLRPHDRADLISKIVPIRYDDRAACPRWEQFLLEIMGNNDAMVDYLNRAVGWTLTGDISEQAMFFLHGLGANGKSTFIGILRALLGEYATETSASTWLEQSRSGVRDDLARLPGARLVSCAETEAGQRLSEALIKQVTGGEPITARPLYGSYVTFQPAFKLWMASNHKPAIYGVDEGIWRRIRLIPFQTTIPSDKRNPRLDEELQRELQGILAWAVRGCLAWQEHRLADPPEVVAAIDEYRSDEDLLAEFLAEHIEPDDGAHLQKSKLYSEYCAWSKELGMRAIGKRAFNGSLSERGWQSGRSNGRHTWRDFRIRDSAPE